MGEEIELPTPIFGSGQQKGESWLEFHECRQVAIKEAYKTGSKEDIQKYEQRRISQARKSQPGLSTKAKFWNWVNVEGGFHLRKQPTREDTLKDWEYLDVDLLFYDHVHNQ